MAVNRATDRSEMRDAFGSALIELGETYPELLFLDADLHTSTKATLFKERYPNRFYQVGIAEQNLFGIAAGLAIEGFVPMPSTFAAFATRRALDQLTISICLANLNVKVPGSYVGIPTSRAGASHNCIEDIAVMRSIPNLKVADPCCGSDLTAIMRAAMETPGPVYFRVTRYAVQDLFGTDHTFEFGKSFRLRDGSDVTLATTGVMAYASLEAADMLQRDGIDAEVLHCASIKPLDSDELEASARKTGCVVTVENATVHGGFGAAVTECLSERYPVPVMRVGVQDRFVFSGGADELFTRHGMTPTDIQRRAKESMRRRDSR